MSGICGIYSPLDPGQASLEVLHKMLAAIGHRGTAARRTFVDPQAGVALGHAFAPAFEAPVSTHAPNWYEDAGYVATLDGAVFNGQDLPDSDWRQRNGDRDTAVVIAHLRRDPAAFPEGLDGVFGLAVWDRSQRKLWLVRDALAVKPLYYCHLAGQGVLLFASELKGILAHPAVPRRLSREGLTAYLTFGYVPAPLSMIAGVCKVFPGEVLCAHAGGGLSRRQYWVMPPLQPQDGELEDLVPPLREQVINTVAKQVEGAGRVGVFLSGGIDSTIVLGVLQLLGVPERPTFSLGFRIDPARAFLADDLHWAQVAAEKYATRHHPILIAKDHDPMVLLPRILRQFDEPMVTPNAYSKYFLSAAARENGVASCLSGSNVGPLFECASRKKVRKLQEVAGPQADLPELVLHDRMKLFGFAEQAELLAEPLPDTREVALGVVEQYCRDLQGGDLAEQLYLGSMRMQGAEKSITVQDRTSVLNGVEVRHPLYDTKLVHHASRIPGRFKGSESDDMLKIALKRAFADVLPEGILQREPAGYPSYYWRQGEVERLQQRLLSSEALARTGLLRPEAVQRILATDRASTRKSAGKPAWALLVLQAWCELYLVGDGEVLDAVHEHESTG